jgi:pimeloyl-ACP methyl ester carboxylesterase
MENNRVFKSAAGRDKILAYYHQVLSMLPFCGRYIDTTFGKTFILEAGCARQTPVILLHGSCSNSAFWSDEMTALAVDYHVLAVDILGEPGNSEAKRYDLASGAYARWLRELTETLSLDWPVVIGNSLGAWMALDFVTAYPKQVKAVVLLAASGIAPNRETFINQSREALVQDKQQRQDLADDILAGAAVPQAVRDFLQLIGENFNPVIGALPIFDDERLSGLTMPLLAVWGLGDIAVEAEAAAGRLARTVPAARVCLLDNCGHVILGAKGMILDFLKNINA